MPECEGTLIDDTCHRQRPHFLNYELLAVTLVDGNVRPSQTQDENIVVTMNDVMIGDKFRKWFFALVDSDPKRFDMSMMDAKTNAFLDIAKDERGFQPTRGQYGNNFTSYGRGRGGYRPYQDRLQ